MWNDFYEPAKPKWVKDGIQAKTKRGSFGSSWWSKQWIGVLESFGWSNRLQRGRSYARRGQVVDIAIELGRVTSHVQGTRSTPYRVEIEMEPISDSDWETVADALATQAIFAAKLLGGEMPEDIEDAFKTARVDLFPKESHLETDCSCPDFANPCKHIAAVYYLLGERFDADPFLIFLLRGRSKDAFLEMLRGRRAGELEPDQPAQTDPLVGEDSPPELASNASFWEFKEPLDDFRIELHRPEISAAVLKRLGAPSFWTSRVAFLKALEGTYAAASESIDPTDSETNGA